MADDPQANARDQITVRVASSRDLEDILTVQVDAFGRVAQQLGIDTQRFPPLAEELEDLQALLAQGVIFFVAQRPGRGIVGSVRAVVSGTTVEIGRLVVAVDSVRQGVATALMDTLESSFPDATRFELFTGSAARVPLALYEGRGYRAFREGNEGSAHLVWLEKHVSERPQADYTDAHD